MTPPAEQGDNGQVQHAATRGRPIISTGAAMLVSALIVVIALGYCTTRMLPGPLARNETKISHDVVVSQIRAVAKLLSSEATVRDVVAYSNT